MFKTNFPVSVNAYVCIILLFFAGVRADTPRAFVNPLNNKAVDVFIVVDESNSYVSVMQLGLLKTALYNIATELNPPSSSPYYGLYFYGASSSVNNVVMFTTNSASAVKTQLDNKQYTMTQTNPSTLSSALSFVSSHCASYCRPNMPRVTVVISSAPDLSAEATIRQLERTFGMTIIIVGIGSTASTAVLNQLASHPTQFNAVPVGSLYELILASSHISSVISDVPRLITVSSPLTVPTTLSGVFYTVLLNTYPYTTTNDTIVMFASNCPACLVFGSLSEPNPTSANTVANTNRRPFFAYSGYPNTMLYFRIPKGTGRFFLSFLGNGMSTVYILVDVFSLPNMMEMSRGDFQTVDLLESIG